MTVSREYIGPVTFTVILHSILLLWMMGSFMTENRVFDVPEPKFVRATLVSMEQKKKKGPKKEFQQKKPEPVEPEITPPPEPKTEPVKEPEPEPQPKLPEPKPEPKIEPKPVVKPEPVIEKPKIDEAKVRAEAEKKRIEEEKLKKAEAEKKRIEEEQRKKAEAEKKRKEAEAEKKRLEEKKRREAALLDSIEDEKPQEESDPNAQDEVSAESYIGMIAHTIGSNWSRPMSARNGMQVVLRIQLIPTGEVIGVSVIKSSGDLAFDRAAVAAVEKSHQFPELAELDSRTFEKNFRTFSLTFNPQDLRL